MNRTAFLIATVAALAVLSVSLASGYWILIHPSNPLTAAFSGPVSKTEARVITGPYPARADLEKLRAAGVETVVCLLDPAIPYEKSLLEKESKIAEELGLRFLNFPMGSILGHRFGDGYERNAAAAAEAVRKSAGKVYLHCYLGMHRIAVVRALVEGSGEASSSYVRGGERSRDILALDRAQAFFEKGRFEEALSQLSTMSPPTPPALLLRGWSLLRLGRVAPASEAFGAALKADAALLDARSGLGYCALRAGDAARAAAEFDAALKSRPEDASALLGLGLARKRQGRVPEAAALFKRVLALEPSNREAQDALKSVAAAR